MENRWSPTSIAGGFLVVVCGMDGAMKRYPDIMKLAQLAFGSIAHRLSDFAFYFLLLTAILWIVEHLFQPKQKVKWTVFVLGVLAMVIFEAWTLNSEGRESEVSKSDANGASAPKAEFSEQFTRNLGKDMLGIPRPCAVKIAAPPELLGYRNQLRSVVADSSVRLFNFNTFIIPVCSILDDERDANPNLYAPHQYPEMGITIHTSPTQTAPGDYLSAIFRSQGIRISQDQVLPPNSPDYLIYIEFGRKLYD
jgi:hypothetical protein